MNHSRLPTFVRCCFAGLLLAVLAGCGTLHGWAQIPLGGKPSVGTSVSVPLGK